MEVKDIRSRETNERLRIVACWREEEAEEIVDLFCKKLHERP